MKAENLTCAHFRCIYLLMVDGVSASAAALDAVQALAASQAGQGQPSADTLQDNAAQSPALAPEQIQLQAAYNVLGIANKIPATIVGALLNVTA